MGPAGARIASVAAIAGYGVASVPLGFADFNGRAFGMNIIAPKGSESKILQVMSAWAKVVGPHVPPIQLVHWEEGKASHI